MKRTAIGVVAGLAIWFGSALAAEAQVIQPTGPMLITSGSTGATYTADITLPSLNDYGVQLYVYRNNNLLPFYSCELWFYSPTSLNNTFSQSVCWTPSAFAGEKFTFKANLITTNPTVVTPAANWVKTVTRPTTYLEPSKTLDLAFESIDRDRRHEA
jgi:hypothetical protein